MLDWNAYLMALGFNALFAITAWAYSVIRRDVSIVDSLWSLMILSSLVVTLLLSDRVLTIDYKSKTLSLTA